MKRAIIAAISSILATVSQADTPVVVGVETSRSGNSWRF